MRRPSFFVILAPLFLVFPFQAAAPQTGWPARPSVGTADPNDPQSYYDLGMAQIAKNPKRAADAFFWATKLNPSWAEPYYAERVALHLDDNGRLIRYLSGEKDAIKGKDVQKIDSLYLYALTLNPFVYQKLDMLLFDALIKDVADRASRSGRFTSNEAEFFINEYLTREQPALLAWRYYTEGNFGDALREYATAISRARRDAERAVLHTYRGRILIQLNMPDSALPEFTAALTTLRKADKKDIVYVYQSKALLEQAIGMTQIRLGNVPAAKEAFAQALQEDLSYFPAHVQLAMLALDANDPATAASEMDLAVQIKSDDPGLRYLYGFTLAMTSKPKEAETQLRKAIELDPVYASPHFVLAQALEGQQRQKEALAEYTTFVALAAQADVRTEEAKERIRELSAASGGE